MRRVQAVALAAALIGLAGAAPPTSDPAEVVRALYAADEPSFHGTSRDDVLTDARLRARFFTRELGRAIRADRTGHDGEAGDLDFDPVSDSQDPMVENLTARTVSSDAKTAGVEVRFSRGAGNAPSVLLYTMVREGGAWRVYNIGKAAAGDDTGWDLRSILHLPNR